MPLLEKGLRNYIAQDSFKYMRSKSPVQVEAMAMAVREVPDAELLAVRGDFHAHTGRPKEAAAELAQAVQLDPRLALAHEGMAFLKFHQNDRRGAVQSLEKAVQLDSRSFLAHYYYAMLSDSGGSADAALAEKHLRRAVELNAEFAPAHSSLAVVLAMNEKSREEAFRLAYKALQLEPGEPVHKLNLARVLLAMSRFDEAERLARNVLDTADDARNTANAEAMLKYIGQYQEHQQAARAREAAARARADAYEKALIESHKVGEVTGTGPNRAVAAPAVTANAIEGVVQSIACRGPQIEIALKTASGVATLRAPERRKVVLHATRAAILPGFDLCRDIDDMKVRATYDPKLGTAPGQLVSLELGP